MATPRFQVKTVNFSIQAASPNELVFQCNDGAGVGVDISSGYTFVCQLTSQSTHQRGQFVPVTGTATYGSTGKLTIEMDASQSNIIPCSEAMPLLCYLTNDAGVTYSAIATGFLKNNQGI